MLNKILNFKTNIFQTFIIIFVINLILFITYYGKLGMFFIDVSREVYIPTQINNGELLYKNIFNIFTPLGYQINAILTNIFGENLNTFYWIGFINSTIILFGLFMLLRYFLKGKEYSTITSILVIFIVMVSCNYSVSLTNYIFPYSYSLIFAMTSIIWSLIALLYFIKKQNTKYLYISSFLYGFSIAFKYDFLLFGIVLLLTIILSKSKIIDKIINLLLIVLPLCISFIELFWRGVSIEEFTTAFDYISKIATSKSNTLLYKYLGFFPTINSIKELFVNFIIVSFIISFYHIAINKTISNLISNNSKKILNIIIFCLLIVSPFCIFLKKFINSNAFYFNWIGLSTLFLIIPLLKKFKDKSLDKNDFLFFIFLLSVLLISIKSIFNISFNSYGTYYFPLLFTVVLTFIFNHSKKTDKLTIITLLFVLFGLFALSNFERTKYTHNCLLKTEKGTVYISNEFCTPVKETCHFIEKNTKKNDTILILPEGAMINFLTNRKSHNKFFHLIPPNLEALDENFVVEELKKDLPDYLILESMSYTNFNETFFCESFGQKICGLIPQYYEQPIVFGENFWLAIYKKKEKNEK